MHTKAHFGCCSCLNVIEKDIPEMCIWHFFQAKNIFGTNLPILFYVSTFMYRIMLPRNFALREEKILVVSLAL